MDGRLAYAAELGGVAGERVTGTPVGLAALPPHNMAELLVLYDGFVAHGDEEAVAGMPLSRERWIEFYAAVREVERDVQRAPAPRAPHPDTSVFGQKPVVTHKDIEAARAAAKAKKPAATTVDVAQTELW